MTNQENPIGITDRRPGEGFRSKVFQQNDAFLNLREADRSRANHEQGGKVQYIFVPNTNPVTLGGVSNQSWPAVGRISTFIPYTSFMAIDVVIPADTVVNSITMTVWIAAIEFVDSGGPTHEWRFAKDMKLYYNTGFKTYCLITDTTGSEQVYYSANTDITNSVFGVSTINVAQTNPQTITAFSPVFIPPIPTVESFTTTVSGSSFLAGLLSAGTQTSLVFSNTDTTDNYFSVCWAEVVVNGYTRNR